MYQRYNADANAGSKCMFALAPARTLLLAFPQAHAHIITTADTISYTRVNAPTTIKHDDNLTSCDDSNS